MMTLCAAAGANIDEALQNCECPEADIVGCTAF
jgi:hypothetical protein